MSNEALDACSAPVPSGRACWVKTNYAAEREVVPCETGERPGLRVRASNEIQRMPHSKQRGAETAPNTPREKKRKQGYRNWGINTTRGLRGASSCTMKKEAIRAATRDAGEDQISSRRCMSGRTTHRGLRRAVITTRRRVSPFTKRKQNTVLSSAAEILHRRGSPPNAIIAPKGRSETTTYRGARLPMYEAKAGRNRARRG